MTTSATSGRGELFIVATPIGNLRDITLRAIDTLKTVAVIYCEDTRHTGILLKAHGITTPTLSYHDHNGERQRPAILEKLALGQKIALISDAGTPLISDPGYKLVEQARAEGFAVTPIPGACAAVTALCASGLPTDQFHFCGFLPPKAAVRKTKLEALRAIPGTLVFYESPRRLDEFFAEAASVFDPGREAVVARELTKTFEEFRRGSLAELAAHYATTPAPKGEAVVLISPAAEAAATTPEDLNALLAKALKTHSVREAAELVGHATGLPKREVYQRALQLRQ